MIWRPEAEPRKSQSGEFQLQLSSRFSYLLSISASIFLTLHSLLKNLRLVGLSYSKAYGHTPHKPTSPIPSRLTDTVPARGPISLVSTMATVNEVTDRTSQIAIDPSAQSLPSRPIASFSPSFQTHLAEIYKSLTSSSSEFTNVQREAQTTENADPLSSPEAFNAYMAGPSASALRPAEKPDTSAPISDYFISSSHNTYLTGNQLYSDAAADSYTEVRTPF